MIQTACPKCKASLTCPDEDAGKIFPCPKCKVDFMVPAKFDTTKPVIVTAPLPSHVPPSPNLKMPLQGVCIEDIDVPASRVISVMVKWTMCAIPAMLILAFFWGAILALFAAIYASFSSR